uniref:Odorant receptor n=1 Tax=Culicoides sonorensis TaxID=179676 RepID=A0A336M6P2_CULSO
MAALDQLETAKKRIQLIASSVGFNVLREDYKFNVISYISIIDCVTYMAINGYDIKLFWGDLVRVCFCLVTWSFGYQGSARIVIFVSKQKTIRYLYAKIHSFMQKMLMQRETNYTVNKFAKYINIQTKALTILFYLAGLMTIIYPLLVYAFTKEVILPFGFVIPGLSDTEQPGYALNYLHHILQVILTVGGLTASQGFNILYLLGVCLMIEVLLIKLKELSKIIFLHEHSEEFIDYKEYLSEIISLHQDILELVEILEELFSIMFLIDVFSISFQIIITLMVCTTTFWVSGFIIMMAVSLMLFIDCAYGLFLEVKFDALCTAVYDLPWHLMTIQDRKTVLFILARSQNPTLLTFGKMAYMNMATFVEVIYLIISEQ